MRPGESRGGGSPVTGGAGRALVSRRRLMSAI